MRAEKEKVIMKYLTEKPRFLRRKLQKPFLALGLTLAMILTGSIGVLAEEGSDLTEPVPEPDPWTLIGGKLTINKQEVLKDYAYGTTPWVSANPAFIMEKLFVTAEKELLYHEKASGSNLYDKNVNNGDKNYTKYTYELKYNDGAAYIYYPSEWCDAFVDWCMYTTYGSWKARELICGPFNGYTPSSSAYYKNKKQWYTTPKVGDQVFFQGSTRINHTGIVIRVTPTHVYTIEGNAINRVRKRVYPLGTSAIAGYGRPNYDAPAAVEKPAEAIKSVEVAQGITKVGDWAFACCSAMTSAVLPTGLTEIGDYAFYNCSTLNSVDLPSTLQTIGDAAFQNTAIGSVWLPSSVRTVGNSAFYGCLNMVEAVIPEGVKKIEEYTFMGCENLKSVTLPSTLTSIQLSAFGACDRLAHIVFAGTREQWNAVQKVAEDNGGGKYNLKATLHFNNAGRVAGFWDVYADEWFAGDVKYAKEQGLMNGTGNDYFEPATGASRGMVVTILYRLSGSPVTTMSDDEAVSPEGSAQNAEQTALSEVAATPSQSAVQTALPEGEPSMAEEKQRAVLASPAGGGGTDEVGDGEGMMQTAQSEVAATPSQSAAQTALPEGEPSMAEEEQRAVLASPVGGGGTDEVGDGEGELTGVEKSSVAVTEITSANFSDVEAGSWYADAVAWAYENGIVNGYEDGRFGPGDPVTRQQLAAILYRYATVTGAVSKANGAGVNLGIYQDASQIGDYAVDALKWVNAAGIMKGTSATMLEPAGNTSRAQLAAVLHRFCVL